MIYALCIYQTSGESPLMNCLSFRMYFFIQMKYKIKVFVRKMGICNFLLMSADKSVLTYRTYLR